ncbi:HesA/MoeB/ThiF family protein [Flavobacterium pectinovorum]|uniref:Molybdopterin-synthase adenylyltransferase n=1 Tax=Flavobacterium pectinovorum TaxID=29533 RepID=A0AB36NXY1_9FLAO|nr:HesA/MoeB/ThiF family protein [Flavobacterium pectinovorum]OXB02310.1 thiamine biosynthesis protein ThiF [Flavobacterium pectinovorum]SHM40087.1 adenylyltransferase and sulfurtransferase [Flavobacterium pectinovorum]
MNTSERYNRQIILPEIGEVGQYKLLKAKVLVIGAGGLASSILPYLAAAGVGEIGIVDDDVIEISNLHRQVIYKSSAVGKYKVDESKLMISELNPLIKVNAIVEKLSGKNAISLFEKYDIIVDATDNIFIKYLINDACLVTDKPMVYGSIFRFQGQVSVFNYQNGPTYRCLFPDENVQSLNCEDAGVIGISVGIIGMLQANEVIKMILEIGEVLSGKILVYNILNNEQQKYDFEKSTNFVMDKEAFEEKYKEVENQVEEISVSAILNEIDNHEVLFLDVRNEDEVPKINFKNGIRIPLMNLENEFKKLNPNQTIYVYCQSGIRSKIAVELLQKKEFKNVKSIAGGALAMKQLLKEEKLSL